MSDELREINKLVAMRDKLSEDEKKRVREMILSNNEARQKAINGAIKLRNYSLAMQLSLMNCA